MNPSRTIDPNQAARLHDDPSTAWMHPAVLPRFARTAGALATLVLLPLALAQRAPHIGYAYPAGGQQGVSLSITLGGQALDGATNVFVSGDGVQGVVLEHRKPLSQREFILLRDKQKELLDRKAAAKSTAPASTAAAWTDADERALAEIRKKLANPPNRQANPALVETVTARITLSPDAAPGMREIRLSTTGGLSNPLSFHVGALPEHKEQEPNDPPNADRIENPLPVLVNGQILPGDVDRFRFTARRGTRLVVAAQARELVPYLADAVPGWFQATLALSDLNGKELAYVDDFQFHPDPILCCEIPADGSYVLEIKDSIYRGREDFVYRIAIGELPLVTSVFPLGARADAPITVTLNGWNLPAPRMDLDPTNRSPGITPLPVPDVTSGFTSVRFAWDDLPECLEKEPNQPADNPQSLDLPQIVNGHVNPPGDIDSFRFHGRAGQIVVAEVTARRLNSPLDSLLRLLDGSGRELARNDDSEDKGAGLLTHHADSRILFTLPADGPYTLHLADAQRQGGPAHAYRLRLSAPRPDFALRVVPSSISARPGGTVPLTVYALRQDGFDGDITLELADAPPGFRLGGAWVPARQDQIRVTLTLPPTPPKSAALRIEGRATVAGRELRRAAVPAEDLMQAFAYRHLVPAQDLMVGVAGSSRPGPFLRPLLSDPVKLARGETTEVRLVAPRRAATDRTRLELADPPEGIALRDVKHTPLGMTLVLAADAAKAPPGLKGNLLVNVFADRPAATAPGSRTNRPAATRPRTPTALLPAIPFEVGE
ncbi:MAG TPA: PPC domain-containing protein [Verrucomicrobiota bacterium]|nr:PPC domain-containing protein [Verrucomicrobiota bacterium]HNU53234.1 PPC domain-containing protein [Verrucomicrobiota bacterium]